MILTKADKVRAFLLSKRDYVPSPTLRSIVEGNAWAYMKDDLENGLIERITGPNPNTRDSKHKHVYYYKMTKKGENIYKHLKLAILEDKVPGALDKHEE